ncbi:MAG: hypothetical protein M3Q73_01820 [bacterium]|nr:hypothetical protein [bacterium]
MKPKEIAKIKRQIERKLSDEEKFISDNWEKMTDGEMAAHLGLDKLVVAQKRKELGFIRPKGRPTNPAHGEFIQANWQTMDDEAMAEKLGLSVLTVRQKRYKLGLAHPRGQGGEPKVVLDEAQEEFLKANWQVMNDGQMAEKLEVPVSVVTVRRREFGLTRKVGPKGERETVSEQLDESQAQVVREQMVYKTDAELAAELVCTVSAVKAARKRFASEFIQANWQTMDDGEMREKLGIGLPILLKLRLALGINRRQEETETSKVDVEALRKAILEEGETLESFRLKLGLDVTRQYMSFLCTSHNINIDNRTPAWLINNRAKRYNCPILADKEKLAAVMKEFKGIGSAAAHLGVPDGTLKKVVEAHGLDLKELIRSRRPSEMIELVCSNPDCHLPEHKFLRKKEEYEQAKKRNPNYVPYCSKACFGHFMGVTVGLSSPSRKQQENNA